MGFERLRESRSDGLKAMVTVEGGLAGRVVGPIDLNMLSLTSQGTLATHCHERVNGLSKDQWKSMVVQACAIVTKQYWEPTPTVDLSEVDSSGAIAYVIPGLVPVGETTVIYGDGGSLKSLMCIRIALSVALGHELPWGAPVQLGNVLYLDWETNPVTVARRLRRVALGEACMTPRIHYRQCFRSLVDELPHIKEEVSRKQISLVIVDSIGFAVSGSLVEDEPARTAMNALRSLSPCTRLVVAHISKGSAEALGGRAKPFGSAFFWNGMRSGIELRTPEENAGQNVMDLGVFHNKSNDDRLMRPFGLSVIFDTHSDGILFEPTEIQEVPDLAARTSLSSRLRGMLKTGSATIRDMAQQLDVPSDDVARVLKRMPEVVALPVANKTETQRWGLSDVRP